MPGFGGVKIRRDMLNELHKYGLDIDNPKTVLCHKIIFETILFSKLPEESGMQRFERKKLLFDMTRKSWRIGDSNLRIQVLEGIAATAASLPSSRTSRTMADFLRCVRHSRPTDVMDYLPLAAIDFREESPLKHLGYTVGKTNGMPLQQRREFLEDFFAIELPESIDADVRGEWGAPKTRQRAQKMVKHVRMMAELFTRNDATKYDVAIGDWEDDAQYLIKKYNLDQQRA